MFKHQPSGPKRSRFGKQRPAPPSRRLYRGLKVEGLENRLAPAIQVFSGLEFMTTGTFSVSNNVVTSNSPVEVGVAPASGGTFTPLVLLQSGIEFNSTDATGTFTTPPSGGSGGAVSAYIGSTTVPLLDAHAHTFEAPALLSSAYDVLPSTDTNNADLGVAGGDLSVTALRFNGSQLDVQGNLSLPDFAGLTLAVSGSNYVALSSSGVALSGLSVALPGPTSFTEAGLDFTATNLQVTYSSATNEFDLSGSATLTAAGFTLDLTLGSTSAPGLIIQNGALESLDATVTSTSNITLGDVTLSPQNLTIQATAGSDVTVTGAASLSFDAGGTTETIDLTLGSTNSSSTQPGLVIDQSTGDIVSFDAAVTSNLTIAGLQITTTDLDIAYETADEDFEISGTASFALAGSTVAITLGGSGTAGLVIDHGALTELDASVTSNIVLGGLTITTKDLTFEYDSSDATYEVSGTASFALAGSTVDITLGGSNTAGLEIVNGALTELDASVTSNIVLGGLTITTKDLTFEYDSSDATYEVSGTATFALAGSTVDITLGGSNTAGLEIVNGALTELDASVTSNIVLGGLTITTKDLTFEYDSSDATYEVSGTATFALAGSTVDITLGGSNTAGLEIVNGALTELDASVTSNIVLGGLTITTNALTFEYDSSDATYEVSGTASFALAGSTVDITLGGSNTAGLEIVNGALTELDAAVTSNIVLGGLTITTNALTFEYDSSDATYEVSGTASFALAGSTVDITLGGSNTAGLEIVNGALTELDASVTSNITLGGLTITTNALTFEYDSSDATYEVSGTATFALAGSTVDITLGGSNTAGLEIVNGALTELNASVTSNIVLGGLTIATKALTFEYDSSDATYEVSGTASFALAGSTVDITLGGSNTAGLEIVNGALTELDASVTSNIELGGLTITTNALTFEYDSSDARYEVSGTATFALAGSTVDITLGGSDTAGLEIVNGALTELDASVTSNITIASLTIATKALTFEYEAADSSFEVSGTASFSLAGSTVSITLSNGSTTNPGGLVIEGGQLDSLDASVTGGFDLLGIDLQANGLGLNYEAATAEFALYGGVSLTSSFLNFSTTLGTEQAPGILIEGGQLQSLDISVSGGFSLFGFQVQANGLTVQYSKSTNELELSGGIMLDFTSVFEVSAAISQGGLLINTQTGALSIPSSGLQITASAILGPFSIQNLMISFSNGPGGVNFSASGAVDLPGGIDVDLTQLVVQNGQLDDIGLSVSAPIPIGDTGFFIDNLSGSLDNLNNISQLVVSASAEISFGDKITIPSLGPIFGGGSFYLVDATGSITVSASQLDLSGSVSILGGLLGQGSASIDLNWTTGIYMVSGNFSMFDDIFSFGGSLTITSAGDITLEAMASVNVPPQIPFIGGDSLGSINFFLQYEPGQPLTQDIVAAWTSINLYFFSFTIGFEVDFQGDFNIINGNDVAGLIAGAQQQTEPTQYVYQSQFQVPGTEVSGAVPTGEQISVTSPIFDGDYPLSNETQSASAIFAGAGHLAYTSFYLPQSDIIMSTLSFTVTVDSPYYGNIDIGTGSFNSQGQLVFQPNGSQGIVPTSALLFSNGELELTWPEAPYEATEATITANYNAADTYFELLQQGSGGSSTVVGTYTIDPVDNDPGDPVQTAQQANLVVPQTAVNGTFGFGEGGNQTVYTLAEGQAVPQTVSFSLYSGTTETGGTLLGTGTFNSSGNLVFVPNGKPSIVPTGGYLGTYDGNPQGYIALTLSPASASTYIEVTYATIANRVIDFQLPSSQSTSSSPAQYTVELVDNTSTPLSSNDPDEVPNFSETTLYQTPTVSFESGSVSLSSSGVLSGTVLANAYTPQAVDGSSSTSVSIYYNTTDSATGGTLIDSFTYNPTSANSSGTTSYPFSFAGFANLPAGSYYFYAIVNDGQNSPVTSSVAGPFTETSPTPVLAGPSYLALSDSDGVEQGVFSAADSTALAIKTNFITPVTVSLSVSGGTLALPGGSPAATISATYSSAAAAVAALNGLMFESNSKFTGASTLTFAVSTTINGTTYNTSDSIPLLTPNTPLEVNQTVDSTVPSNPSEFNVTVTVTNNPNGPDAQNGTDVQVLEALSPGLTIVSATPSEGTFNETNGVWTIGNLPLTGANSATLVLVLQAVPSAQGQPLSSSATTSSALFIYPASDATNLVAVKRPQPITITVSNLNDSGAGSLRNALEFAENGDTIAFSPGLSGTIDLTSGELLINQDVTIIGPTTSTSAPTITISGGSSSRVFDIEGGASGANVTLENLDIENGLATSNSPNLASAGGGLLINDAGGTVAMSNVLVSGNVAQGTATAPAQGGGIAFLGGTGTFSDDTFANNKATAATGGAASGGALAIVGGNVTIITDTIADNTASGGTTSSGGGISISGASSLTLSNDTIADNTAGVGGDVAQTAPAFVEALNSVFASSSTTATDPDFAGTVAYSDHNLVDNTTGSTGFSAATGDLLNINAELAALGNNGGPLPTMPPLPGSPLIDAGDTGNPAQSIPGLVGLWQGNGNANDATGSNDLTLDGGATFGPGEDGTTGFVLNGTSSYLSTASNPANLSINDVISVSAIVNPSYYSSDSVIIDKTGGGNQANYRFGVYYNGELYFWNGSQAFFSTGTIPVKAYSQVGFTLKNSTRTLDFYINGQLAGTSTATFGSLNSGSVLIGHDPVGGYFAGTIQDLAVYHGILTAAQMSLLATPSVAGEAGGPTSVPGLVSLIGVEQTTQAQTIPGLVSDAQGTVEDLTGDDSEVTNSAVAIGPGVIGEAMQYNGTTSAVTVADSSSLDTADFTIAGWFNVSAAPAAGTTALLATKSSGASNGWTLSLGSTLEPSFSLSSSTGSVTVTSSQALSLNTWYYITGTFNGTTATLYVNGAAVGTATLSGGYTTTTSPLILGAAVTDPIDFYGGQGNALDGAGPNSGTIVGTGVGYTTGLVGQAFDFTGGAGNYIALGSGPDIVGTGAFAVALWVNTTSTGSDEYLLSQRDPNNFNGEYVVQLENGQVNFAIYGDSQSEVSLTTSQTVADGNWHLIVAQRLANGMCQIFIDGTLAASQSTTAVPLGSGFGVFIGEDVRNAVDVGAAYAANYSGLLEGVQILNTALTSTQIAKLQTLLSTQIAGDPALTTDDFSGAIDNFAYFNQALLPAQIRSLAVTGTAGNELATTNNLMDFYAGQGNALDSVGTNSGTIVGDVSYAPGVVGQAFDFSGGEGNYISLGTGPDVVGTGAFALAVWVNTTSDGSQEYILSQRDPNNFNGEYVLQLENGQVNFSIYGDSQSEVSLTTSQTVNNGNWHLIVAERLANGTCQIYIGGALAAFQTTTAAPLASGFGVYIGEDVRDAVDVGPAYDFNYAGLLAGVQIFNTALAPTQIANLQTSLAFQIMATTDERGDLRRVGGGLDIGADEYQYDLMVTGSAPASVPSGNLVTYTLTVTNDGPDPVAGATFTDILPAGVVYAGAYAPAGWAGNAPSLGQGGTITFIDGLTLAKGASAQFTIYGNVTSAALSNTNIDDIAAAGPSTENATPSSSTLTLVTEVPNGLGILSQPTTATMGSLLSPAITVNVVDNSNNTVTTDNTQLVTLSIASGPAGATLSGTTTVRAVNGVATFTGLSVNLAGTYVFVATGGDLTPAYTNSINVAPVVVTSPLSIQRKPLKKVKQTGRGRARTEVVKQVITIKNTGRHALTGPVALQVNGLLAGVKLSNASGSDDADPYLDILTDGESLAPNHSLTETLDFTIDGNGPRNLQSIYKSIDAMLGI